MSIHTIHNTGTETKRITILNSKGGCGKSMMATNLASIYTSNQLRTTIMDYDPQGSSLRWIKLRPDHYAAVHGINAATAQAGVTRSWQMRVPPGTDRLIIDTPAGVRGMELNDFANNTDYILIPVVPSDGDIHATTQLIAELLLNVKIRTLGVKVGVLANRVKKNTRILEQLYKFLEQVKFPCVSVLRDTQNYVNASKQGLGIHEIYPASLVQEDIGCWDNIIAFLEEGSVLRDHKDIPAPVIDIAAKRQEREDKAS